MANGRQQNWIPGQRVDIPHLRAIESAVVADFDAMCRVVTRAGPLVVNGLRVQAEVGQAVSLTQVILAGATVLASGATAKGTVFAWDQLEPPALISGEDESLVSGDWTNGVTNYLSLDIVRAVDPDTVDTVFVIDEATKATTPVQVPLARTAKARFVISTLPPASTPSTVPLAQIAVGVSGTITSIADIRPLAWGLDGEPFPWTGGRAVPADDEFTGAEKDLTSLRDLIRAMLTRLWEIGGGSAWFTPTADRDVKVAFTSDVLGTGNNVHWTAGTETLRWQGLEVVFANSDATHNLIADNATGVVLEDGQGLYVDLQRGTDAAVLTPVIADLATVGQATPGQRFVLAWRRGADVYVRDYPFEVNRTFGEVPGPDADPSKFLRNTPSLAPTWELVEDTDLEGGFRVVPDAAGRTGIAAGKLKDGMLVLQFDTRVMYERRGATWRPLYTLLDTGAATAHSFNNAVLVGTTLNVGGLASFLAGITVNGSIVGSTNISALGNLVALGGVIGATMNIGALADVGSLEVQTTSQFVGEATFDSPIIGNGGIATTSIIASGDVESVGGFRSGGGYSAGIDSIVAPTAGAFLVTNSLTEILMVDANNALSRIRTIDLIGSVDGQRLIIMVEPTSAFDLTLEGDDFGTASPGDIVTRVSIGSNPDINLLAGQSIQLVKMYGFWWPVSGAAINSTLPA